MKYLDFKKIPEDWKDLLNNELKKDYMRKIDKFLLNETKQNKNIYPHKKDIFRAFELTKFKDIKVVIIGQDPYHGKNQAHGLCFSVNSDVLIPPSLRNIFKELINEKIIEEMPESGDLSSWAKSGVLLLNNVLTVEEKKPASHKNCGWEEFTDFVVKLIDSHLENIVFLLWGSHAQKKGASINRNKQYVLESTHPSPFSAYKGFLGSNHFVGANKYLKDNKKSLIDWSL